MLTEGEEKVRYATADAKASVMHMKNMLLIMALGSTTPVEDPFSHTLYKIFSEVFEHEREVFASDMEVELSLTFSEAAKGCRKHVSFRAQVVCDSCYGRGHPKNAKPSKCPNCNGIGRVTAFPFTSTCSSYVRGLGKFVKDQCQLCKGSGVVEGVKNINVSIPAGVDSGIQLMCQRLEIVVGKVSFQETFTLSCGL
ncbi:hypothetical protein J5N97_001430 [Dioscorea zingiberensis]|uniref:CR-type domain-containing protein n=1 Tax=Dioscorea zingiberensis TaxID=325984 RepID=A0A9D5H2C8_9LILI|nr:hypothetical protein J5N97_001430 [Dioscorea zingiberensis]